MENGVDSEVHFKADAHEEETRDDYETEASAPPTPITQCDMDVIIRGWEEKFQKMMECLSEVQRTSERASSDMCLVSHEARIIIYIYILLYSILTLEPIPTLD